MGGDERKGEGEGKGEREWKRVLTELFTNALIPSVDSTRFSVWHLGYTHTSHQTLFTFCKITEENKKREKYLITRSIVVRKELCNL